MSIRTLRGTVPGNGEVRRLIIDDGNFNVAYKVLEFYILSSDPRNSTAESVGTLALQENGARTWTLSDSRQIAWAGQNVQSTSGPNIPASIIDPDHVVLQDLWVWGNGTTADPGYQYLVVLEQIVINDDEAVLQLIKERGQDDL